MIHFKPHWHFPKWIYSNRIGTKLRRKCSIYNKEQKSNSILPKNHTHWETIK